MSYFELSDKHRRSFSGRLCRYVAIETPQELYSFNARADRPDKPDPVRPGRRDPMYFLTKSNLLQSLPRGAPSSAIFESIQHGVALCEDWGNDMRYLFILNIPAGLQLHGWVGLAKFQPRGGGRAQALEGGWLQYIIDIDARLRHYLDGPIATGR